MRLIYLNIFFIVCLLLLYVGGLVFIELSQPCDLRVSGQTSWRECECRGIEVVTEDDVRSGGNRKSGCIGGIENITCYEVSSGISQPVACLSPR